MTLVSEKPLIQQRLQTVFRYNNRLCSENRFNIIVIYHMRWDPFNLEWINKSDLITITVFDVYVRYIKDKVNVV